MKYTFSDLVDIIAKLRGKGGCPWDAEQTHASLRRNLIEEAYEAIEAIDSGDGMTMADELGDLLMQIVFHAQIGTEDGAFTIDDVTDAVCTKMIRRHPHVFADAVANTSAEVLSNWEEIKKEEKKLHSVAESMASVSRYLPALMRAEKVQGKASGVGFDWTCPEDALEKVREETAELETALAENTNIKEEIGDLLFAAVNTARLCGIEPEEALTAATDKFLHRFKKMEEYATKNGKKLDKMHIDDMEVLWDTLKNSHKK
ncbi:MAG: nucleoside triphosphate pyrophosphohydrolase [Clostridia bacterium]|nr:nucleoside triphosphate pyrophosphohydrolase [Clostridia bacterium]